MATRNLFTTYGSDNLQIIQGKTKRVTVTQTGDPIVTITVPDGGTSPSVSVDTWYQQIANFTCIYQYVGMTKAAAETCAEAMRTKFTRSKTVWQYGYQSTQGGGYSLGWYSTSTGTVLDSEIAVIHDVGSMYHVEVHADVTDETYTTSPTGSLPSWPSCFSDL